MAFLFTILLILFTFGYIAKNGQKVIVFIILFFILFASSCIFDFIYIIRINKNKDFSLFSDKITNEMIQINLNDINLIYIFISINLVVDNIEFVYFIILMIPFDTTKKEWDFSQWLGESEDNKNIPLKQEKNEEKNDYKGETPFYEMNEKSE